MRTGIAGEFRCVITGADGAILSDTGYQKNLILNQGLDFFGGSNGEEFNRGCAIGSGNSAPTPTQIGLDSFVAHSINDPSGKTNDYSYTDTGDGLYKIWEQRKYRFQGLSNVNISEVGLVSNGNTQSNYFFTTRALIKDSSGAPTSITIKTGETLDIYYKIHKVIETGDKNHVINVIDGNGDTVPHNVVVRPMRVGNIAWSRISEVLNTGSSQRSYLSSGEPSSIVSSPTGSRLDYTLGIAAYTTGTYKRVVTMNIPLSAGNISVRTAFVEYDDFLFMPFQARIGSVANDSALLKTEKHIITIPFEISWGRYEGVL